MNKTTSKEIINTLKKIIPNPICELNFNNCFELICAVLMSAQTTDKRVNMITPELFKHYPTPKDLMNADVLDVKNAWNKVLSEDRRKELESLANEVMGEVLLDENGNVLKLGYQKDETDTTFARDFALGARIHNIQNPDYFQISKNWKCQFYRHQIRFAP